MANQRDIITQTLENMNRIYKDVGQIAQIVEEGMRYRDFKAIGDAAITWEVSTAYNNPSSWLYRWFARVFTKDDSPQKAVGYCIHLGNYAPQYEEKLQQLGVFFPFANVSLLEGFEKAVNELRRPDLYNCLWGAGWFERVQQVSEHLVGGRVELGTVSANAVTYFVDLLALNSRAAITELLKEPMVAMFNGKSNYVSEKNLPVIRLKQA